MNKNKADVLDPTNGVKEVHDSFGKLLIPDWAYWGPNTQRSYQNFKISSELMPIEVIKAIAIVKSACASANNQLNKLPTEKKELISEVCEEILSGNLNRHFPLLVWQTGSGTQTNMNVNEVISQRAKEINSDIVIHPNDDVNMSQSSNDVFPTAMHIAAVEILNNSLIPSAIELRDSLKRLELQYSDIVKIGRTHLQDATPLTLGQEISGWRAMLDKNIKMLKISADQLCETAIGGTAVGTGLNSPKLFSETATKEISKLTGYEFRPAENKFHSLTSKDELVFAHGAIKALASNLMKIANDIRWLSSGPRCGLGELNIPENEPGSSIMPGKVNPTQCEALTMVVIQVFGNDSSIGFASSQGNFELNVYMPVMIFNFLQSARLLSDAMVSFRINCVNGITPNKEKIEFFLQESLMLVTALNPHIGYDKATIIAKNAHAKGITLRESAIESGYLTEEQFDQWVIPSEMVNHNKMRKGE